MPESTKPEEKQKKEVKNEKEDEKTELVGVNFYIVVKSIVLCRHCFITLLFYSSYFLYPYSIHFIEKFIPCYYSLLLSLV